MVCLELWIRCLFLLVMFLAVHHCIFLQPRIEVKGVATDFKNKSSLLSQKQIVCDHITPLIQADPNNKTVGKVPSCAENETSSLLNSTNLSDQGKINVPSEFPQEGSNRTTIVTTKTIQNTLHLNNTTDNLDLSVAKAEATLTNANMTELVNLNETEVKSNSPTINATDGNLNVSRNDTKSNNQTESDEVPKEANIAKADTPTLTVNNASRIDTEVSDLLNTTISNCSSSNQVPDSPPNVTYNASREIDRDTELIEDGQNTEDVLRNSSLKEEKVSRPGVPLVQGQLAAILAGVFVVLSVTAYVGLLSWRRYLEKRYGNRQMLVNEDEFNDDLRHFSI